MTRKKEINASQPATTRIATPLADLHVNEVEENDNE